MHTFSPKARIDLYSIIILLLAASNTVSGQSYSTITYDKNQTTHFGATNLITIHHILYDFEDRLISDTLFRENNCIKKTAGAVYRLGKLFLLDQPSDAFIALTQHEVFGHGFRYRELEYGRISYNMTLAYPYCNGDGFSTGTTVKNTPLISFQERLVLDIGGVEANKLLADNITHQVLLDDSIHFRQGLLFMFSQNNLFRYLWKTRNQDPATISASNDMNNYVYRINNMYQLVTQKRYDVKMLSNQSFIAFANPLQAYSALSVLYHYVIKGEKKAIVPMIKIGSCKYLPALNYALTPFGSEYHFCNFIRYRTSLFSADFSLGENTFHNFYGVSLKGFNIVNSKRLTLNSHIDVWNQPELELDKLSFATLTNETGGSLKIDILFRPVNNANRLGLFFQPGFKTKGYSIGEQLAQGYMMRFGLSMHL